MLQALEALGLAIEGHFHILLPTLVRLLSATGNTATPKEAKQAILNTMARLLPRMRLAPYASAVLHPLILCLRDTRDPDIAADALNAVCSVAVAIGDNMALFILLINNVVAQAAEQVGRGALPLERWSRLVVTLQRGDAAPCVAWDDAARWGEGSGWAAEMDRVTYNRKLDKPPENPHASQHRGQLPTSSMHESPSRFDSDISTFDHACMHARVRVSLMEFCVLMNSPEISCLLCWGEVLCSGTLFGTEAEQGECIQRMWLWHEHHKDLHTSSRLFRGVCSGGFLISDEASLCGAAYEIMRELCGAVYKIMREL
jgi:hypothetical protein